MSIEPTSNEAERRVVCGVDSDSLRADWTVEAGRGYVEERGLLAGEEGAASPTLSLSRTVDKAHASVLANGTSAQNIGGASGVPVYIKAIYVMEATAGTVTVAGFSTPTTVASLSTTKVYPIGTAIGNILPECGLSFPAGCNITLSDGTDGPDILVAWEEMP